MWCSKNPLLSKIKTRCDFITVFNFQKIAKLSHFFSLLVKNSMWCSKNPLLSKIKTRCDFITVFPFLSEKNAPRRCLGLVVAVGLACSNDLKSYAGGSVATGRVSQAGQVKSEVPD
jgi:hypothetical protein